MRLGVVPLAAGFGVAALVAGFPASAADQTVNALAFTWDNSALTVGVGESVTWANGSGVPHNVCVAKPGDTPGTTPASCTEFMNGPISADWSTYTNKHAFATAGTYKFICQQHPTTMTGTVTVGGGGTTTSDTGTGTNTGTGTTTTQTGTQT